MRKILGWSGRARWISSAGLILVVALVGVALLSVVDPGMAAAGKTRHYYIAADELDWDYAPMGYDNVTGRPFGEAASVFVQKGPDRIGKVYRKSIYREYTDATFKTLKPVSADWKHLGMLGPVIHAEVGDTIIVDFKNNSRFPSSIHPHGVFYKKDSEGAPYADGTAGSNKADDAVESGQTHTYTWEVPERAGPGPGDPSSVLWMYHSHTDEVADSYGGLIGPMIVTARGQAKPDGSPKDIDREFVTMFEVSDENQSAYLGVNIDKFTTKPDQTHQEADEGDEEFGESNLMHSINGYVYGTCRA